MNHAGDRKSCGHPRQRGASEWEVGLTFSLSGLSAVFWSFFEPLRYAWTAKPREAVDRILNSVNHTSLK